MCPVFDVPNGMEIQVVYPGLLLLVDRGRVVLALRRDKGCWVVAVYRDCDPDFVAYLERILWA